MIRRLGIEKVSSGVFVEDEKIEEERMKKREID